jgi:hypothetical protein
LRKRASGHESGHANENEDAEPFTHSAKKSLRAWITASIIAQPAKGIAKKEVKEASQPGFRLSMDHARGGHHRPQSKK